MRHPLLFTLLSAACVSQGRADDFFEAKVRPILVEHCYKCHSEQPGKEPKGGLRVDSRAALLKGGDNGPSIVAGNADKSKFIEAIRYTNTDLQMPPKGKLSDQAIAHLVKWVNDGAVWPNDTGTAIASTGIDVAKRKAEHWAWKPIRPHTPPLLKNVAWPQHDIDRFILAKLEEKGLKPADMAEPRTLVRRVYYDLVGLPPTPTQVETFLADYQRNPPKAMKTLVDQLLESPHFGERWARHWLDLVRYGESRGHEFDPIIPNAYQYRDYVIRAFNADVPYNQFVKEHLAGDLLKKPRLHAKEGFNESILGTGFWFLGEEVHSPVDIRQDQADRFDNRIDVLTKTFMALTVSCARCHDHKFDAITTKDYYALFGILESSSYRLVRFETQQQHAAIARKLSDTYGNARKDFTQAIRTHAKASSEQLPAYLLAAREAILLGPSFEQPAATRDIVFDDFETGTYGKWELSGTAFGDKPQTLETIAPYQGKINAQGKYFVNSHNRREKDTIDRSDRHQGRMLSAEFTIERGYITMLVGGGAHKDKTCVNLLIDGKVVRTATGQNNNQMFPVRWDVRDLRGQKARLQIVDEHTGGWGNIGVDAIVFTDASNELPMTVDLTSFSVPFQRQVTKIAEQHKLDASTLSMWIGVLLDAAKDSSNPFYAWAKLASDPKADDPKHLATVMNTLRPKPMDLNGGEVVLNYATSTADDWRPDDATFGTGPTRYGDVRLQNGFPHFITRPAAEYDRVWDQLSYANGSEDDNKSAITRKGRSGRMIRTPSFKLNSGHVYYLVRGSGTAYAAVSAHTLIAGPLHGRLVMDFPDSAGYRWVHHDLTPYKGQLTHIEFVTSGHSDFAVAMVVQGDRSPTAPPPPVVGEHATTLAELAKAYQTIVGKVADGRIDDAMSAALANVWLTSMFKHDSQLKEQIGKKLTTLRTDLFELGKQTPMQSRLAMAMLDGNGVDENVFIRGSPKGLGDPVPRRFLEALTGTKPLAAKGSGRDELAELMTDPKVNPFITRVIVNRVWHHLFGRGLVASVDNFGVLGESPSHPELLDYLATRFANDGWSIKTLIREMMLSRTYQMSSRKSASDAVDPQNLLLHRMNLRRMDGESIRDALLQISGRLDRTMYGPSVPIYLTPFLDGRGKPGSGPLDGNGRRSLYLATKRNFLSPFLQAFDTPIPFSTVGRRQVSNVPAQALILLNDPFVHQQAGLWAKQVWAMPKTTDRLALMYQMAFARSPSAEERVACNEFLAEQAKNYNGPDDPRPWTDLAHMLFNTKEFIYVD